MSPETNIKVLQRFLLGPCYVLIKGNEISINKNVICFLYYVSRIFYKDEERREKIVVPVKVTVIGYARFRQLYLPIRTEYKLKQPDAIYITSYEIDLKQDVNDINNLLLVYTYLLLVRKGQFEVGILQNWGRVRSCSSHCFINCGTVSLFCYCVRSLYIKILMF